MNDDVIPVYNKEWENNWQTEHFRRMKNLGNRIAKEKKTANVAKMSASRQSREPIMPPETTSQNSNLQNELNTTKNELNSLKHFHNNLQSQINELKVDLDTKNKLHNALEKQLQYVQQTNYEMHLTYISSIQQIVDLIVKRTNGSKNNEIDNNVTFEPSTENTDLILKILDGVLKTQTKWEPLYPDVKHLHKQNLDNSRVNNDQ